MTDWQNRRPELFTNRVISHPRPDTYGLTFRTEARARSDNLVDTCNPLRDRHSIASLLRTLILQSMMR